MRYPQKSGLIGKKFRPSTFQTRYSENTPQNGSDIPAGVGGSQQD